MPVTLRPLPAERMPAWLQRSAREYAADLIVGGHLAADAHRVAVQGMADSFPEGAPSPGHRVFDVIGDAGETVGYLWIGPYSGDGNDAWWVWDIVIDENERGRGLGRATMVLAERYAKSQGARTLGLSVFGFNAAARHLYESLGYGTTTIKMSKALG